MVIPQNFLVVKNVWQLIIKAKSSRVSKIPLNPLGIEVGKVTELAQPFGYSSAPLFFRLSKRKDT